MRCKIEKFSPNFDGTQSLSLTLFEDFRRSYDELKDVVIDAELKKYHAKRSLDANAYMWVLIGKISAKVGQPPDYIYREAIRDIGGNYTVLPIRDDALDQWKALWSHNGVGWICEEIGESKLEGYTNVRNFHGSSTYDKAQMARLIDVIATEAKECGIETMTPAELEELNAKWQK